VKGRILAGWAQKSPEPWFRMQKSAHEQLVRAIRT
jgi:hypothetical protein